MSEITVSLNWIQIVGLALFPFACAWFWLKVIEYDEKRAAIRGRILRR